MKRMLINATHQEERRVAIMEDNRLTEVEVEREDQVQLKGNIYKATISRVEPSLQAAFLDIGSNRNGFLQINDIHSTYFQNSASQDYIRRSHRPPIQEVIRAGQEIVVQVVKDERDLKGATLTSNLSIPGRYLVLMVGNQRGGVSRKIADEGHRKHLKVAVQQLRIPAGMGVIVRTAGLNKTSVELQRDLDSLLDVWEDIIAKSLEPASPKLLYAESDLAIRSVRDYLRSDFDEVLIDDAETFQRALSAVEKIAPNLRGRIHHYTSNVPLFSHFGVEDQVRAAIHPEVKLPSGGSIVISATEAVVAIDVNSGRATSKCDVEETAFQTNREAAEAIGQQLRLRDLGGLIVIDFIDMLDKKHKSIIERNMREAVKFDRAKIEIGRISKFGLLELSRQRLKTSLIMQNHVCCSHCQGRGLVRMSDSAALEALRKVEAAIYGGGVSSVRVHLAPSAALFLLNEKRKELVRLEEVAKVLVFADSRLRPEEYELILDNSVRAVAAKDPSMPKQIDERGGNSMQSSGSRNSQSGFSHNSSRSANSSANVNDDSDDNGYAGGQRRSSDGGGGRERGGRSNRSRGSRGGGGSYQSRGREGGEPRRDNERPRGGGRGRYNSGRSSGSDGTQEKRRVNDDTPVAVGAPELVKNSDG